MSLYRKNVQLLAWQLATATPALSNEQIATVLNDAAYTAFPMLYDDGSQVTTDAAEVAANLNALGFPLPS